MALVHHHNDCECCAAARRRIAEVCGSHDRKSADLQSWADQHKAWHERAQEFTNTLKADWAAHPWAGTAGTWFNMTSPNTRMAVTALMARIEELEAQIPAPAPE